MDGRENSGSYLRLKNLAAFARHTKCRTKDSLGCSGTETNEDFWPNNSHLCFEPWTAGCNFTWARFFVNPAFPTWFPLEMFNGICDVDFITSDACFFQRPIENFPRWPDKWLPNQILLITWLFAHEQQTRVLRSFTEHRLSRPLEKRARSAIPSSLCDGPQG